MGRGYRLLLALVVAWAAQGQAAPACAPAQIQEWARVEHVYDGDTVRLSDGRKVRFIGVNTPEVAHGGRGDDPLGEAAKAALTQLLRERPRVGLVYDAEPEDRYRRRLAHLYLEDRSSLQYWLLRQGYAAAIAIPPNLAQLDCYRQAEAQARREGRGIWREPRYRGLNVAALPPGAEGFYVIQGRVENVSETKQQIELRLRGGVSAHINRRDWRYFTGIDLAGLQGREVRVRGWLRREDGGWRLQLRHPMALEVPRA